MEGLLSMLLFAGLFFVMMRFGCGTHVTHGRHGSHEHGRKNMNQQKSIDPVCGMEVDVKPVYGKMYGGMLYRFCSRNCLDKFDSNPGQYVAGAEINHNHQEGGER